MAGTSRRLLVTKLYWFEKSKWRQKSVEAWMSLEETQKWERILGKLKEKLREREEWEYHCPKAVKISLKSSQKPSQSAPHEKYLKQQILLTAGRPRSSGLKPRSSGPLDFPKFRWSISWSSCIEIGSILCSFFITFHHISNGGIRSQKPFPDQNGAPGTPGS